MLFIYCDNKVGKLVVAEIILFFENFKLIRLLLLANYWPLEIKM